MKYKLLYKGEVIEELDNLQQARFLRDEYEMAYNHRIDLQYMPEVEAKEDSIFKPIGAIYD